MYLSRLLLSSSSQRVQADLWQPYELHRTVMGAFADAARGPRVLYRADLYGATPSLLVQSHGLPSWGFLPEDYVLAEGPVPGVAVRYYEPELGRGQALAFRLRANPTRRHHGKRRAWLTGDEQRAWLYRKGEQGGFAVVSVACAMEGLAVLSKGPHAPPLRLSSLLYEGVLEVTDPELCVHTIASGVGSAKAFGFGLLSLAQR